MNLSKRLTSLSCMFYFVLCCAESLQSCPTLGDPMDRKSPSPLSVEFPRARILEWVAMPSFRGPSWPRDQTHVSCVSCIASRFFTTELPGRLWLPGGKEGRKPLVSFLWHLICFFICKGFSHSESWISNFLFFFFFNWILEGDYLLYLSLQRTGFGFY